MPTLRTTALTLLLLAPACGDNGGSATQDSSGAPDATTGTTTGTTAPTENTDTTASTDDTVTPTTTTDDSTSTGTVEPDTDTDTTSGPPPDPCDGLTPPEPASAVDGGELFHDIADQRYAFTLEGYNIDDVSSNSWDVFIDNLGPDEPTVGTLMGLEIIANERVGMLGTGTSGTATLEIVSITPDCVTGRVSDLVTDDPTMWITNELPGGFVIGRRAL